MTGPIGAEPGKPGRTTNGSGSTASSPKSSGQPRNARKTNPPPRPKTAAPVRSLIETRGPDPSTPINEVRLTIGRIAGTHGVHGELKLRLLTDHPEHLLTLKQVFLGESLEPVRIGSIRLQPPIAIIQFAGVNTPEEGKALGGLPVRIPATDAKPLDEGEYFLFQLIGLRAVDAVGATIGTVTDLIETGAHDVLVITPEGAGASGQVLVPNHPRFVMQIAPEKGLIVIQPPDYGD